MICGQWTGEFFLFLNQNFPLQTLFSAHLILSILSIKRGVTRAQSQSTSRVEPLSVRKAIKHRKIDLNSWYCDSFEAVKSFSRLAKIRGLKNCKAEKSLEFVGNT